MLTELKQEEFFNHTNGSSVREIRSLYTRVNFCIQQDISIAGIAIIN